MTEAERQALIAEGNAWGEVFDELHGWAKAANEASLGAMALGFVVGLVDVFSGRTAWAVLFASSVPYWLFHKISVSCYKRAQVALAEIKRVHDLVCGCQREEAEVDAA